MLEKTLTAAGYRVLILHYTAPGVTAFFHTLIYTSDIWRRIGVLDLPAKTRAFLALDMPYGIKSQCQPRTRSPENVAFVNEVVKHFCRLILFCRLSA
jgi:hypothetical protein